MYIPVVYEFRGKWYHNHCNEQFGPFDTRKQAEESQANHFDEKHS